MPFIAIPDKYFNKLGTSLVQTLTIPCSICVPEGSVYPLLRGAPVGLAVVVVHIVLRPARAHLVKVAFQT